MMKQGETCLAYVVRCGRIYHARENPQSFHTLYIKRGVAFVNTSKTPGEEREVVVQCIRVSGTRLWPLALLLWTSPTQPVCATFGFQTLLALPGGLNTCRTLTPHFAQVQ